MAAVPEDEESLLPCGQDSEDSPRARRLEKTARWQVPSEISSDVPSQCHVAFAQVLSRHGARDPTISKSLAYSQVVENIKSNVSIFQGDFAFLANYSYALGADQLTDFGKHELVNSGRAFFSRYEDLAKTSQPFARASGQRRVIDSAQEFNKGFYSAKTAAGGTEDEEYPYNVTVISEAAGSNNTLDHGLCTAFEASNIGSIAQSTYAFIFTPAITVRLNANLPNANLTLTDTISIMDLCPFETVASLSSTPSPFCNLFTQAEWEQYDYYQTLGKYYGYGPGNPLGPTQGVGLVNELVARLTGKPVIDHTSVNQTLDTNPSTFPLGRSLYADFGHDNDMTAVFAALGLYNSTVPLSTTHMMTVEEMHGYSAALTVPFAARAYFEKLQCEGEEEEMVRVLVNGRVLPLESCGGDALGRCTLGRFVDSLGFAQAGGHWNQCFGASGETDDVEVA
ncbi:MAG: hypothetical protein ALECFALPRED_009892 [Alectoria fallacina]|uniref:Phytase A n=1 Tax=Alectoria fallacina TaxID=1903189 RepID=A0A8H3EYJ9_9LECA|nr:MAG: hypothetical protein ALECFALPRED_009892 [Alectoria fallacina]